MFPTQLVLFSLVVINFSVYVCSCVSVCVGSRTVLCSDEVEKAPRRSYRAAAGATCNTNCAPATFPLFIFILFSCVLTTELDSGSRRGYR